MDKIKDKKGVMYPKSGICPFCKKELELIDEERSGKILVECPSCEARYKVEKMTFDRIENRTPSPVNAAKLAKLSTGVAITTALLIITSGYYFGLIGGGIAGGVVWIINKYGDNETTKVVCIVLLWLLVGFVGLEGAGSGILGENTSKENKLQDCLKRTKQGYNRNWNYSCGKLDREKDCSLPSDEAERLNEMYERERDICYDLFLGR